MDPVVWCNLQLHPALRSALADRVGPDRLVFAQGLATGNLPTGKPDLGLGDADVAFGQPEASQCAALPRLRWVHLSSAGYTSFDSAAVREAFAARGAILTTSSHVFAEPCAQHTLAFLLAHARRLPEAIDNQRGARAWPKADLRRRSHLLAGQKVLLVGMGTIARRLCELLAPFGLDITGVRRQPDGREVVPTVALAALDQQLPSADYVIDILPGSAETTKLFDANRFARCKPGAVFINIGRGTTVDQDALASALTGGVLGGAYLDVTNPEPLPPDHPLWSAPGCVITPHTAGGHADESDRLVAHFLDNFTRWQAAAGRSPALRDRVF